MKDLVLVSRTEFIGWTKGILVDIKMGIGFVVNELACKQAEEELKKGNKIGMTVNNKLYSYLVPKSGKFVEQLVRKRH
jgi:hypothetical protein